MATDRIPLTFYKGNFKKYIGKIQKSEFWHFEPLNPFTRYFMTLVCIPEVLMHLLTPIMPYLYVTRGWWHICQIWHFWHFWHKWRIWHPPFEMVRYGSMGVKISVRTSGMQTIAIKHLLNMLNSLKCQNTDFLIFSLYFLKFPLYNIRGLSGPFPCSLRLEILQVILNIVEEWDKLCC